MSNKVLNIGEHTIEICGSGTGSIDPWSATFARSIDLSLFCTADMAEFILIDRSHIYKLESFNDGKELHDSIELGLFNNWEQFENEWLNPKIEKRRIRYDGTLEDSIDNLVKSKMRDEVWKSIPRDKKRKVYEYLKSLPREETEKWYEGKIAELGITPVDKPSIESLRNNV